MEIETMTSGRLVADGRSLLEISTVFEHFLTAVTVYPVPDRPAVRRYAAVDVAQFAEPSTALLGQYEAAYGLSRTAI